MRLTTDQITTILEIADHQLGRGVSVRVYGSRLKKAGKGGDLDLLLESPDKISILQRAEFKLTLENILHMPVDVLSYQHGTMPSTFQSIALANAVQIG